MNYNQYIEYVKDNKSIYSIYNAGLNCKQILTEEAVR
jgi:hypothetical protein